MTEQSNTIFYIISDSVGETALRATNATLAQYPQLTNARLKRYPFINSLTELSPILEEAKKVQAIIITTLVNDELNQFAEEFTQNHKIPYHNVVRPIMDKGVFDDRETPKSTISASLNPLRFFPSSYLTANSIA